MKPKLKESDVRRIAGLHNLLVGEVMFMHSSNLTLKYALLGFGNYEKAQELADETGGVIMELVRNNTQPGWAAVAKAKGPYVRLASNTEINYDLVIGHETTVMRNTGAKKIMYYCLKNNTYEIGVVIDTGANRIAIKSS